MRKNWIIIFKTVGILGLVGGAILIPHFAHANPITSLVTGFAVSGINNAIAQVANVLLMVTAWFVAITGTFLNISVTLTTHIKDIYNSAGVTSVWITIRDLSSIFIIFGLLYFSILTIVGKGGSKVNELIVKVFLAGILINFSLFFVRVGIDASNLVSLQFYNAIAPGSAQNFTVKQAFTDGGLSDVFMNHLQLPTIYKSTNPLKATDIGTSIILATVGGIILMVTAGISFLAAGVMFIARTAILLFVMALSPLYFAGMIYPQIQSRVSDPLMKMFRSQLIFMPVYLALLYVGLRVISDPSFYSFFNPDDVVNTGPISIGIIIQFIIAILFIDAPLVAALTLGGIGGKWAPNSQAVAGRISGFFGRNFVGRPIRQAGKGFDKMAASAQETKIGRAASTALRWTRVSQATRGLLQKGEGSKYGGVYTLAGLEKEDKDRTQYVQGVAREQKRKEELKNLLASSAPGLDDLTKPKPVTLENMKKITSKMSTKELEDLDDKLKNPQVAASLSTKQVEGLLKDGSGLSQQDKDEFKDARIKGLKGEIDTMSSGDYDNALKEDFNEEQKKDLKDAREAAYNKIIASNGVEYLLTVTLKKPQDIAKLPKSILENIEVIRRLPPQALKEMINEKIDIPIRNKIRTEIESQGRGFAISGKWPNEALKKSYNYLTNPAGNAF